MSISSRMPEEMLNTPIYDVIRVKDKYEFMGSDTLLSEFTAYILHIHMNGSMEELKDLRLELLRRMYEMDH